MTRLALLLLAALVLQTGCNPYVWEVNETTGEELGRSLGALILLGNRFDNRKLVQGPHAEGSQLPVKVARQNVILGGPEPVDIDSDTPDVVAVERPGDGPSTSVDLLFLSAGEATLRARSEDGGTLASLLVEVRAVAGVEAFLFEDLVTDRETPAVRLDVVESSRVTLVTAWVDAAGERLTGRGLVDAATDRDDVITFDYDGQRRVQGLDSLDVLVAANAPTGDGTLEIAAGATPAASIPIRIHDAADLDSIEFTEIPESSTQGHVAAELFAGDVRIVGRDLQWFTGGVDAFDPDDELGEGVVLEYGEGDPTPVTACLGALCAEVVVPGEPERIQGARAGCSVAGGAAGLLPLLVLGGRRRRR